MLWLIYILINDLRLLLVVVLREHLVVLRPSAETMLAAGSPISQPCSEQPITTAHAKLGFSLLKYFYPTLSVAF